MLIYHMPAAAVKYFFKTESLKFWSTPRSYDFCFNGVEPDAVVAIGMVGCKKNHPGFMRGYNAMPERISPSTILCLETPFSEMEGNIISVDYRSSRKVVR